MKQISLIRHAESNNGRWDIPDIERPLNATGERNAPRMAAHLRKQGFCPDIMLSSTATRAAATAETIAQGIGYDVLNIRWEDAIYEAQPHTLMQLISEIPTQHTHVAIVGHNPAVSDLANQLQHEPIDNMPACCVISVDLPIEHWAEISVSTGTLRRHDTPETLP